MRPSIIVHGGAWDIPDHAVNDCRVGCRRALAAGWVVLNGGGSALDAVEAAVVVLENDPLFDAGFGSHLNLDGRVECDAIVMDGASLRAGSIAGVQRIRNPICLARKVLENCPHMMLVAEGAERFAVEQKMTLCLPEELVSDGERNAWLICRTGKHSMANHFGHGQGTVGAVALDSNGALFAATSTGGTCCKLPGRVGDSPLIGCGCYADSSAGGVSCTGMGEAIMKVVMAKKAADLLSSADGAPKSTAMEVANKCVRLLAERTQQTAGLILLDRNGDPGFAYNTPRMAYGFVSEDGTFVTGT